VLAATFWRNVPRCAVRWANYSPATAIGDEKKARSVVVG